MTPVQYFSQADPRIVLACMIGLLVWMLIFFGSIAIRDISDSLREHAVREQAKLERDARNQRIGAILKATFRP